MPFGHWSRTEKQAYRAAFTIGRIVDEIWVIIAIIYFAVTVAFGPPMVVVGGFLLLGGLSYWLLPKLLPRTMPEELRRSLPLGRFDGPTSPSAPRTYRELFRRWFFTSSSPP